MPASFITSASSNTPSKSFEYLRIASFAGADFFTFSFVPCFNPICLPFRRAVSIPSRVLWCRSATSSYACWKEIIICSLANAIRYLFTPSRIKSKFVPVIGIAVSIAVLKVFVFMCGSLRKTSSTPRRNSSS